MNASDSRGWPCRPLFGVAGSRQRQEAAPCGFRHTGDLQGIVSPDSREPDASAKMPRWGEEIVDGPFPSIVVISLRRDEVCALHSIALLTPHGVPRASVV